MKFLFSSPDTPYKVSEMFCLHQHCSRCSCCSCPGYMVVVFLHLYKGIWMIRISPKSMISKCLLNASLHWLHGFLHLISNPAMKVGATPLIERVVKLLSQPFLVFQVRVRAKEWELSSPCFTAPHFSFKNQYGTFKYNPMRFYHVLFQHSAQGCIQSKVYCRALISLDL